MSTTAHVPPRLDRVPSQAIADIIDEILACTEEQSASSVYRALGHRLGIHSTTLLRYHQGRLRSAPPEVLAEARRLLGRARQIGTLPPPEQSMRRKAASLRHPRVPAWRLAHQLDRLIEMLELAEPSALHRLLAIETGIHATTVLRFHRGVLRSAPQPLLDAAAALEQRVRAGEAIRFPHGSADAAAVTRTTFAATVDALMATGLFENRNAMLHRVEDALELPRGRLTRLYRCRTFRWVPDTVQGYLELLQRRCQYDPACVYAIGDRFHHHLFGPGTVIEKARQDKVRVRFDEDGRVLTMRERLREDRYWRQPSNSPSPGEAYSFGSMGR
jgi:hypothetical protein